MNPSARRRAWLAALAMVPALGLLAWTLTTPSSTSSFGTLEGDLSATACLHGHGGADGVELTPSAARDALAKVNAALVEHPRRAALLSQKVHLGLQVDVAQAIDACRAILDRDPGNAFALGHLASAYLVQRQYDAALRYAAQLEQRHPGPDAWNLLATVFLNLSRLDQAQEYYEKTLREKPGHPAATHGVDRVARLRRGEAIP